MFNELYEELLEKTLYVLIAIAVVLVILVV